LPLPRLVLAPDVPPVPCKEQALREGLRENVWARLNPSPRSYGGVVTVSPMPVLLSRPSSVMINHEDVKGLKKYFVHSEGLP
jgi:hypothetical protein